MNEEKDFFDNFKGNLRISMPIELMKDKELSPTDKMLYAIIDFHTYMKEYCWVTNTTLAKEINTSTRTIQRSLEILELKGYIRREVRVYKGKNQRLIFTNNKALEKEQSVEDRSRINEEYAKMIEISEYNWI